MPSPRIHWCFSGTDNARERLGNDWGTIAPRSGGGSGGEHSRRSSRVLKDLTDVRAKLVHAERIIKREHRDTVPKGPESRD